jgi:hypothetical protein
VVPIYSMTVDYRSEQFTTLAQVPSYALILLQESP